MDLKFILMPNYKTKFWIEFPRSGGGGGGGVGEKGRVIRFYYYSLHIIIIISRVYKFKQIVGTYFRSKGFLLFNF